MATSKRSPARSRRPRDRAPSAPGLPAFLAARRQRRQVIMAVVAALLAAAVLADRAGLLLYKGDDLARYDGQTFEVVYVVDGDTLDVGVQDGDRRSTRVRLWGVAAPEMAWPERGRADPEPFAELATAFVRDLAEGERVRLELEPHRLRGDYGRLLAHVYLADGTSLNERVIAAGFAEAHGYWSHSHLERYARAEREARAAGRGMWEPDAAR